MLLGRGPERIVQFRVERQCVRRRRPHDRAGQAFPRALPKVRHGLLGIIQGYQSQTFQPLGRIAAKFGEPIVVDLKTGALKTAISDPEHTKPERGVEHIACDTVLVHVFESLRRIPTAAVRSGVREVFQQVPQFFDRLVGAKSQDHIVRLAILFDEPPSARFPSIFRLHMRRNIAVFFRQALPPKI